MRFRLFFFSMILVYTNASFAEHEIFALIARGDVDSVTAQIAGSSLGPDLFVQTDDLGRTPAVYAATFGQEDIFRQIAASHVIGIDSTEARAAYLAASRNGHSGLAGVITSLGLVSELLRAELDSELDRPVDPRVARRRVHASMLSAEHRSRARVEREDVTLATPREMGGVVEAAVTVTPLALRRGLPPRHDGASFLLPTGDGTRRVVPPLQLPPREEGGADLHLRARSRIDSPRPPSSTSDAGPIVPGHIERVMSYDDPFALGPIARSRAGARAAARGEGADGAEVLHAVQAAAVAFLVGMRDVPHPPDALPTSVDTLLASRPRVPASPRLAPTRHRPTRSDGHRGRGTGVRFVTGAPFGSSGPPPEGL